MFWRQTITRIRPGVKTVRGSEVPDWDNAETLEIKPCSVQPNETGLSQDGRVLGINEGQTAYIPWGSDVKAGDHIEYEGNVYEIDGEPQKWYSASGNNDYVKLALKRYQG